MRKVREISRAPREKRKCLRKRARSLNVGGQCSFCPHSVLATDRKRSRHVCVRFDGEGEHDQLKLKGVPNRPLDFGERLAESSRMLLHLGLALQLPAPDSSTLAQVPIPAFRVRPC